MVCYGVVGIITVGEIPQPGGDGETGGTVEVGGVAETGGIGIPGVENIGLQGNVDGFNGGIAADVAQRVGKDY